jgi:hypothetical protein
LVTEATGISRPARMARAGFDCVVADRLSLDERHRNAALLASKFVQPNCSSAASAKSFRRSLRSSPAGPPAAH